MLTPFIAWSTIIRASIGKETFRRTISKSTIYFIQTVSTIEFAQSGLELSNLLGNQKYKWNLGIPFYGREIVSREAMAYYDIVKYTADNYTDEVEINGNLFYYNSKITIVKKIALARLANVGGIVIWELGHDATQVTKCLPC